MRAHLRSKEHLLNSCFEGDLTDKNRASFPTARWERARKRPLHRREIFHLRGSIIIARTTKFVLRRPLRCILRVQGCQRSSYVMFWWEVPHQGVTHLHFCKKGVKLVSECIKRTCHKELWNVLTWPSTVVRNGSSSRTHFQPKSQDDSGVVAEECSGLYQRRGLTRGESRPQPPVL